MKSQVSIDKAGRVVLPILVRRRFHLAAGDRMRLELLPDGVFLRTQSRQAGLVEEDGLLAHDGEAVGELAQAVEQARSSRDNEVLGVRR